MVEIHLLAYGSKEFFIFIKKISFVFFSKIDESNKPLKIHPLPHMYVVKDLVPVRY